MSDSIALQKAKDYVNIRQFVKECRRRWGMDKEVAKEEWKTLLADPKVPKSEDEPWLGHYASVVECQVWPQDLDESAAFEFSNVYI